MKDSIKGNHQQRGKGIREGEGRGRRKGRKGEGRGRWKGREGEGKGGGREGRVREGWGVLELEASCASSAAVFGSEAMLRGAIDFYAKAVFKISFVPVRLSFLQCRAHALGTQDRKGVIMNQKYVIQSEECSLQVHQRSILDDNWRK